MPIFNDRWTEYTLYRTALDHFGVFDSLHDVGPTKLLGGDESVWYSDQFDAWNVTAAFDGENRTRCGERFICASQFDQTPKSFCLNLSQSLG